MRATIADFRSDGALSDDRMADPDWLADHLPGLGDDWLVRSLVARIDDPRFTAGVDAVAAEIARRHYGSGDDQR